jgi:hypothetical protein
MLRPRRWASRGPRRRFDEGDEDGGAEWNPGSKRSHRQEKVLAQQAGGEARPQIEAPR